MTNWYYVQGSERVGPVTEQFLQRLFLDNEINLETYVWKKGFENWERIKNVKDLNFDTLSNDEEEIVMGSESLNFTTNSEEVSLEESSHVSDDQIESIIFNFSWNDLNENEECFFIKIGKDRKNFEGVDVYGPYSFIELKEAIAAKRINKHTLIFSAGMEAWQKIQDTPLYEDFKLGISSGIILNEMPLLLVHVDKENTFVTLVKKSNIKNLTLIAGKEFKKYLNKKISLRLFVGSVDKEESIEVEVLSYDLLDQTLDCKVLALSDDAKKILLNHAG